MTDYTQLMLAQLAPQFAAQNRPRDPYSARRNFGLGVLQQGMSGKPVSGAVEGLARALQAGLGGYLVHKTNQDQDTEEKGNASALAAALQAVDKDGKPDTSAIAAALSRIRGMEGSAATLRLADIMQRRQQGQAAGLTGAYTGMPVPGATPPGGIPTGAAPPADGGGFNVGNIRMPQGQPGFRTFPTQDAAVGAVAANLRAYPGAFNGGQPMNLLQIGARWAPKGDGNNDPVAWAANVARVAGIDPRQPIDLSDPQVMARIAKGIHVAEFGQGALYPDEVYLRGVSGGQPQQPPVTAPPSAPPVAQPPQVAPPVAAVPGEGSGIDDSGQDRGMSPGFATGTVPPMQGVDSGAADYARAQRLLEYAGRGGDPKAYELARQALDAADKKRLAAQQRQDKQTFEPPSEYLTQGGAIAVTEGGKHDPERIKRESAAQTQGRGVLQPGVDPNTGAPGLTNPVTGEFKPAAAPFTEAQGKAATFADRMSASERNLREVEGQGTSVVGSFLERLGAPGNFLQSPEYQRYEQARRDFINAQLRRESGAVISPEEFANAERQYFPRPGDSPAVIEQKRRNRQIALEGMGRDAGPAYKPRQDAPQAGGDTLQQARDAIAKGAPRDKVIERLRSLGVDPGGL